MYKILGGDGKEYGPISADNLRQWINEGRANAQTQVQPEGGAWIALGQLPEFLQVFTSSPVPGGTPGTIGPGYAAVSGGTNPMAITGMVLGICSITIGLFCCGWGMALAGIVFSVIGLVQTKNSAQSGRGMAIAGLITSIIGLVVGIVLTILFGLISVLGK